jgi:hypothetical protein
LSPSRLSGDDRKDPRYKLFLAYKIFIGGDSSGYKKLFKGFLNEMKVGKHCLKPKTTLKTTVLFKRPADLKQNLHLCE